MTTAGGVKQNGYVLSWEASVDDFHWLSYTTWLISHDKLLYFWELSAALGAIQVLRNAFFGKLDPHPPPS